MDRHLSNFFSLRNETTPMKRGEVQKISHQSIISCGVPFVTVLKKEEIHFQRAQD